MTELTSFGPRSARLLVAAGLFAVLLVIAAYVRDPVIRPYGGDVLVAAFLYFGLRGLTLWPQSFCAAAVFALAVVVEVGQGGGLIGSLGLDGDPVAEAVLGSTFDPADILAYALGLAASAALDRA